MAYIHRSLEQRILDVSGEYSCLLLTGPRQSGKTAMLEHLMAGTGRRRVSLDDLQSRLLAQRDPYLFMEMNPAPVLIEEVQHAPELFSLIKIQVDDGAPPGSYWLTTSQSFLHMTLAGESLAGRMAVINMSSLSQAELYGDGCVLPMYLEPEQFTGRSEHRRAGDPREIWRRIWKGSMPGLHGSGGDWEPFYSSMVQTLIYFDIADILPRVDKALFAGFLRAAASRTGQIIRIPELARDAGVTENTAGKWLLALEKADVIFWLRPYTAAFPGCGALGSRLYFFDTGLVAFLTGQTTPERLMDSSVSGAALENYVVSELRKMWRNSVRNCLLCYYPDREHAGIDLVVDYDGHCHPMIIRREAGSPEELLSSFRALDRGKIPRGGGAVFCLCRELAAIDPDNFVIPVWMI